MAKLARSTTIRCLFFGVLVLAPNSWAQKRPPILEQLAKTYGLDSYGQIEAIRYTWNGEIPGVFKLAHMWEWEPKTGKISYEGQAKAGKPVKVSFIESQFSSQPDSVKNEVEPAFVNDNYWLIFPFHAYWDKSATVTDQGMKKLPVGAGSARVVVVKSPEEAGGFSPRGTLDLSVSQDHRAQDPVYPPRGAPPPHPGIAQCGRP